MAREKSKQPTRQLYAQIREDIYLDAKAKAAEMRVPLRAFIENALSAALVDDEKASGRRQSPRSVWDDEYLSMQERQPIGSPVELTSDEAGAILRESLGSRAE